MKSSRWLSLAVVSVGAACNLYNDGLLEQATGGSGATGGTPSGGEGNDGSGAVGSGAAPNTGGKSSGGGTGGEDMGGSPGDGGTGGASGGSSGGGSGGVGAGGSGGGSGGSTGGVPSVVDLVDDLSSETLVYSNAPFFGTWTRYAQETGIVWVPTSIDGMVAEDSGNYALHVNATFTVDSWGVDVVLPLQESSGTYASYDLTEYTGVRFRAKRVDAGTTALKASLEDEASHRGSTLCVASGAGGSPSYSGPDCDNHAVAPSVGLTTSWKEFYVPFTSFTTGVSGSRDEPLDATKVYAIHFQMNPSSAPVDFWLDDIYLVTYE